MREDDAKESEPEERQTAEAVTTGGEPTAELQQRERHPEIFAEQRDSEAISVLVVDDDPDMAALTQTYLEKERGGFDIDVYTNPTDALDGVESMEADAIVSDYDMPRMDGLELLEAVRDSDIEIPFILFTGKGSEEIASKAISMGVTDYLQKDAKASKYSVLANRIENYVEQHRAKVALERSEEKFSKLVKNSTDVISIIGENARFEYLSPAAESVLGYKPEELIGECVFDYAHPDDRQYTMEKFFDAVENPQKEPVVQFRFKDPDRTWPILEARGRNLLDDDTVGGFLVNSRDITTLKSRERQLEHQNEKLDKMQRTLTHDIRNPLNVATSSLSFYRDEGDEEYLDRLDRSLDRIDQLIERVQILAKQETEIGELENVSLEGAASAAWEMVATGEATLQIAETKQLKADRSCLQQLFENLFRNAIDHAGADVTVTVGTTEDGFYVADDGPGIPDADHDKVFESGFSTHPDGTGFGLAIVEQICHGHDWEVDLCADADGGARFEVSNVTFTVTTY
jgi:PAS domain S-box-containing protein